MEIKWILSAVCLLSLIVSGNGQCNILGTPTEYNRCFINSGVSFINEDDKFPTLLQNIQNIFIFEMIRLDSYGTCGYMQTIDSAAFKDCMLTVVTDCQTILATGVLTSSLPQATDTDSSLKRTVLSQLSSVDDASSLIDRFITHKCNTGCVNNTVKFATIDECSPSNAANKGLSGLSSCGSAWNCMKASILACPLLDEIAVVGQPALANCDRTLTTDNGGGDGGDNGGDGGNNGGDGGDNGGDGGNNGADGGTDGGFGGDTSWITCPISELISRQQCIFEIYIEVGISTAQKLGNVFLDSPGESLCQIMVALRDKKERYLTCYRELLQNCHGNLNELADASIDALQADDEIKVILKVMYKNILSENTVEKLLQLDTDIACNTVCSAFVAPMEQLNQCDGSSAANRIPQLLIGGLLPGTTRGVCTAADGMMTCLLDFLKGCNYFDELFSTVFIFPPSVISFSEFIPACKEDLPLIEGCDIAAHAQCLLSTFPSNFDMVNPMNATNVIIQNTEAFCTVKDQFNLAGMIQCLEAMTSDCAGGMQAGDLTGMMGPMAPISNSNPLVALRIIPDIVKTLFDELCSSDCQGLLSGRLEDPTPCYLAALEGLNTNLGQPGVSYADYVCDQVKSFYSCNLASFGDCKLINNMLNLVSKESGVPLNIDQPIPDCTALIASGFGTCDLVKLNECAAKSNPGSEVFNIDASQLLASVSSQRDQFCMVAGQWNIQDITQCYREYFDSCGINEASLGLQNMLQPVSGMAEGDQVDFTFSTVTGAIDLVFGQVCKSDCQPLFSGQKQFDPSACLLNILTTGDIAGTLVKLGSQDWGGIQSLCDDVVGCMRGSFGQCTLLDDVATLASGGKTDKLSCTSLLQQFGPGGFVPGDMGPTSTCDQKVLKACLKGVSESAGLRFTDSGEWDLEKLLTWTPRTDICKMDLVSVKTCFTTYMSSCGLPALTSIPTSNQFEKAILQVLYDPTGDYWSRFECTLCSAECSDFEAQFARMQGCFTQFDAATALQDIVNIGTNLIGSNTAQLAPLCSRVESTVTCLKEAVGECGALAPFVQKILTAIPPEGLLLLPTTYCSSAFSLPFYGNMGKCPPGLGPAECDQTDFTKCEAILAEFHTTVQDVNKILPEKCNSAQDFAGCVAEGTSNCLTAATKAGLVEYFKVQIPEKLLAQAGSCVLNWDPQAYTAGATPKEFAGGLFALCAALLTVINLL